MIVCDKCKNKVTSPPSRWDDMLDILQQEDVDLCEDCFQKLKYHIMDWIAGKK